MLILHTSRNFTDENSIIKFCLALENNISLKHLLCSGHNINYKDILHFANSLKNNKTLISLSIGSKNNFDDQCLKYLLIHNLNNYLLKLDLDYKNITFKSGLYLSNLFKNNINLNLNELILSRNNLNDDGIILLSNGIKYNNSLKILNLSNNNISNKSLNNLCISLKNHKNLITLDLSYNNNIIGKNLNESIGLLISNNKIIKEINLNHCNISDEGCLNIYNSLNKINFVHNLILHLKENNITHIGINHLSLNIIHFNELLVSRNKLGIKGFEILVNNLSIINDNNFILNHIDISQNDISIDLITDDNNNENNDENNNDNIEKIINSIEEQNKLHTIINKLFNLKKFYKISFLGNQLGYNSLNEIGNILKTDNIVKHIDLNAIGLSNNDNEYIKQFLTNLSHNNTLEILELGGNEIDEHIEKEINDLVNNKNHKLSIYRDKETKE